MIPDPKTDENATDGYPRENQQFLEATKKVLQERDTQATRADEFLREMSKELRRRQHGR